MAPPVKHKDKASWNTVSANFARLGNGKECTPGTGSRVRTALAFNNYFSSIGFDDLDRVTYDAQALLTPTGTFALPKISLIDYTSEQFKLIGDFMDILGQRL